MYVCMVYMLTHQRKHSLCCYAYLMLTLLLSQMVLILLRRHDIFVAFYFVLQNPVIQYKLYL